MPRAGLTPERLAVAGAELADEVGFEQVTVSAVARAFDVKVASLYSHVKSSNDLKTRIALLALEEMADQAADAVAGRSGRDALTAFATCTATTRGHTLVGTPRHRCASPPRRPRPRARVSDTRR